MSGSVIDEAYRRVRARFSDKAWFSLPPKMLTEEIYREIRQIDAERMRTPVDRVTEEPVRTAFAA